MKLLRILFPALAFSLVACAATTPDSEAEIPGIAPINTFYDTIWVRGEDSAVQSLQQVAGQLSSYDVVFFGEFHGHSGVHLAQMQLFAALQTLNPDMTLSLEQFERDTQQIVDQYLKGEIGEKTLQQDGRGWDNYEQSYRPLFEYAKEHNLPVLAANAPKEAVICVGKKGPEILDEMPMPDRSWVAEELNLFDGPYKDKYLGFMDGSKTHNSNAAEDDSEDSAADKKRMEAGRAMAMRSFSAQVLRDDTMAESITRHLQANPGRKVIHLDGNFHSASGLGTVERLKLRMPELRLAVINPVAVTDSQSPSWTEADASSGDFILLVKQTPDMFVNEDREMEYMNKVIRKRMRNKCVYSEATDK